MIRQLLAISGLFLAIILEGHLFMTTNQETADRAPCDGCGQAAILIYTPGAGWLCEACDLNHYLAQESQNGGTPWNS